MRQQGALWLPRCSARVDEQETVLVVHVNIGYLVRRSRTRYRPFKGPRRLLRQVGVRIFDDEDGRIGVLQLVQNLGRSQPPRDRNEDEAGFRAREEDLDVL